MGRRHRGGERRVGKGLCCLQLGRLRMGKWRAASGLPSEGLTEHTCA